MSLSEEDKAKLDAAAENAKPGLEAIAKKYPDAVVALGQWFQDNITAGYKRLAKQVVALAKE